MEWLSNPTGRHAYILSWFSLVITFIAAVGGVVASVKLNSSLMLVYGLENVVDFFSSAIVLWRFFMPDATPAMEAKLKSREKRASIGISIVLALLGGGTIITSAEDFGAGKEDYEDIFALYYVAFISMLVFGFLAWIKFHYGAKLESPSLKKDGVCSAIGAALAAGVFGNTVLTMSSNGDLWWMDPLFSLICGIGALVFGLYGIFKAYVRDGHPICNMRWWIYGESSLPPSNTTSQEVELGIQPVSENIQRGNESDDEVVLT